MDRPPQAVPSLGSGRVPASGSDVPHTIWTLGVFMTSRVRSVCLAGVANARAVAIASSIALAPSLLAQQPPATGAIEGRITEAGTGRPLAAAQVVVAATTMGAATNDNGTYRIANAPARQVVLRVRLIGFTPVTKTVVVTAGQTVRADFEIQVSALQLEQVVVTGSGQQVEVKKLGNTVAVIQPPPERAHQ